jgi:hypothetical protein
MKAKKSKEKEIQKVFPLMVSSLYECTRWMERIRLSGDAGDWEWDETDEYTKAINILTEIEKLKL